LVRLAKKEGIELRQSYERLGKRAFIMQGRYSHARQPVRAKKEQRRLRLYLGRVVRDIERKHDNPQGMLATMLERPNASSPRSAATATSSTACRLRK